MVEPAHLLGTGGAIGAILRFGVGRWLVHDRFPFATQAVNVAGSFVMGIVIFAGLNNDIVLFVGVGACGSFTTYSSFAFDTVRLWETGDRSRASIYALGTLGVCLLAAGGAALIASFLTG